MKNTMKRIMALALVLAMIIGVVPSVFAVDYVNHFTDVPTNKWYAEYVEYVNDRGWMNGIGNNLFGPDDTLERAMVATVLYRKAGSPAVAAPSTFTDVPAGKWYSNAVAWAQANGVVNGVSATEFAPSQNVLREELVTMIWRGAGSPVVAEDHLKNFPDAGSVRAYAKAAFNWAIANNIIGGSNGKLLPQDNATRAEFAKIMTQYDKLENPCESHKWDDGKVTKEATCTEAGEKTYTCTVCGATKVVAIAALGHVDANKDNICDRCGEKLGDTPTPPTPTTEKVVIYYAAESKVMTTEEYTYTSSSSGKSKVELVGADATLEDGKVKTSATNVAEFEMTTVDGITTFKTADGKYLYVDGTDVKLVDAEGENTKFVLEDAEGGKFIRCATAKVNENAQYIEFYKNYFTVYRMDSTQAGIYTFGLYPLATGGDEPNPPTPVGGEFVLSNELKDGDEVVLYNPGNGKALASEMSSYYVAGVDVTPADDKITDPDAKLIWTVKKNDDGSFTFTQDGGKVIGAGSRENNGKTYYNLYIDGEHDATWTVETANAETSTNYIYSASLTGSYGHVYVEWYAKQSAFSAYDTSTDRVTEKDFGFQFYVKTADAPHVHTWNDGVVTTEPTCTEAGVKTFTCTGCGETKTEAIAALGHIDENKDNICDRCGEKLGDTPIPATKEYKLATELKDGDEVVLYNPGNSKALASEMSSYYVAGVDVTPADDKITDPDAKLIWTVKKNDDGSFTFTQDGGKVIGAGSRENNGKTYYNLYIDGEHDATWTVETANAETSTNYIYSASLTGSYGHVYVEWYAKQSAFSAYDTSTDRVTEKDFGFQFYVKTAEAPHTHTWDDGVVTTEPTCTEAGVKTFTCTGCGETKTEPVDALGHNYVAGVCSRCGDLLSSADSIVIYYTNDVHTYVDKGLSYDNIAALKKETAKTADGVLLLDAGDHIQGTAYGALDEGEQIIALMNAAGYDAATLGNHEFDYGMARALAVVDEAEFPYLSANFKHVDGTKVLDAYKIFEVGGKKIAIIGITTPESITKSTPAYFMDETQTNWLYTIDGDTLYADVQAAIDAAKAENPDYVIALGHLGDDPSSTPWRSVDVIANTTGLDAFIDGHSHSTVEMKEVADKDGKNVVLTQTGSYFDAVGKLVIKDGKITTSLIKSYAGSDEAVKAIKDALIAKVDTQLGEKIGTSEVNLTVNDANGKRAVRSQETNLGDFTADALRYYFNVTEGLHADVAIMNGGGIRANMDAGDLTYKSCKTVHTFGNVACLMEVTGQQILDALEWGAKDVGVGENGGFLQVSGLTYEIHSYIPSTVQQADKIWTGAPTGEYRVKNVKIGGEDLDLNKTYTLAGYNYTIRNMGDGFNMFKDAKLVKDYVQQDYLVLANYVKNFPEATVKADNSPLGANYSDIGGEGRIKIVAEKPDQPDQPTGYVLATELKDGDEVIIVNAASNKAMSEEAVAEKYRAAADVAPVDGVIASADSKIVWTVAVVDGGYQFKNDDGETLSATSGLSFAETDNVWALTDGTVENTFIISSTTAKGSSGDPKSIEWYEKYSEFSTFYKNDSNESLFAMNFYVKKGSDAPHVHTWDDGVVTTEPTCTAEGVKTFTCTGCAETKTEPVAALGHNYVNGTCTRCGAAEPTTPTTGKYVPATSFEDGDKIVVVATQDDRLFAMSNAIEASVAPAVEVTATTEGALNDVTDAIVWTIVKNEDGTFYLTTGDQQLTVSKGNVSLAAEGSTFTLTATSVVCSATTTRALFTQLYNGSYRFKNYAASNLGTANYASAITVYKYVAG